MRISFYQFPQDWDNDMIFGALCDEGFYDESDRNRFDRIHSQENEDPHLMQGKVSWIKKMMRKHGGAGFTEHYERDGGLFEVTNIELSGNNSSFKYNRHL